VSALAVAPLRRRALERKGMTPEEELELLIQEQARDDETWIIRHPENIASLDSPRMGGEGTNHDFIGVDEDGHIFSFLENPISPWAHNSLKHGYGGYTKYGCRCRKCKDGNAAYRRARRAKGQS